MRKANRTEHFSSFIDQIDNEVDQMKFKKNFSSFLELSQKELQNPKYLENPVLTSLIEKYKTQYMRFLGQKGYKDSFYEGMVDLKDEENRLENILNGLNHKDNHIQTFCFDVLNQIISCEAQGYQRSNTEVLIEKFPSLSFIQKKYIFRVLKNHVELLLRTTKDSVDIISFLPEELNSSDIKILLKTSFLYRLTEYEEKSEVILEIAALSKDSKCIPELINVMSYRKNTNKLHQKILKIIFQYPKQKWETLLIEQLNNALIVNHELAHTISLELYTLGTNDIISYLGKRLENKLSYSGDSISVELDILTAIREITHCQEDRDIINNHFISCIEKNDFITEDHYLVKILILSELNDKQINRLCFSEMKIAQFIGTQHIHKLKETLDISNIINEYLDEVPDSDRYIPIIKAIGESELDNLKLIASNPQLDVYKRGRAIRAIGFIGKKSLSKYLIKFIRPLERDSEEWNEWNELKDKQILRLDAIRALGDIADPRILDFLLDFSENFHDSSYIRDLRQTISMIPCKDKIERITERIESTLRSFELKKFMIYLLAHYIDIKTSSSYLISYLEQYCDSDRSLSCYIFEKMEGMIQRMTKELDILSAQKYKVYLCKFASSPNHQIRKNIAEILKCSTEQTCIDTLLKLVSDKNASVVSRAINSIPKNIYDPRFTQPLISKLHIKNTKAGSILANIKDPQAISPLFQNGGVTDALKIADKKEYQSLRKIQKNLDDITLNNLGSVLNLENDNNIRFLSSINSTRPEAIKEITELLIPLYKESTISETDHEVVLAYIKEIRVIGKNIFLKYLSNKNTQERTNLFNEVNTILNYISSSKNNHPEYRSSPYYDEVLHYVYPSKSSYNTYSAAEEYPDFSHHLSKYHFNKEGNPYIFSNILGYEIKENQEINRNILKEFSRNIEKIKALSRKESLKNHIEKTSQNKLQTSTLEGQILEYLLIIPHNNDLSIDNLNPVLAYQLQNQFEEFERASNDKLFHTQSQVSKDCIQLQALLNEYGDPLKETIKRLFQAALSNDNDSKVFQHFLKPDTLTQKLEKLGPQIYSDLQKIPKERLTDRVIQKKIRKMANHFIKLKPELSHKVDSFVQCFSLNSIINQSSKDFSCNWNDNIKQYFPRTMEVRKTIISDLQSQAQKLLESEIIKYNPIINTEGSDNELHLRGYFSKNPENAHARMIAQVCIYNPQMRENENYFEYELFNEKTKQCSGTHMLLEMNDGGKKYLLYCPNPSERTVEKVSAEELYNTVTQDIIQFAKENSFDAIVVDPKHGRSTNREGLYHEALKKSLVKGKDGTLININLEEEHVLSEGTKFQENLKVVWHKDSFLS
ncbi:HEAT repeat domain-containing protein [Candidatus Peregrinibacteria bacterium]|jgi:hypothetical protein|nr:HEAT repeat domain-containing protein [Candidatus Peregrinibacteria bacterium]